MIIYLKSLFLKVGKKNIRMKIKVWKIFMMYFDNQKFWEILQSWEIFQKNVKKKIKDVFKVCLE